ncbi:hypothetical protein DMUE_3623 [Dictyocoela muelleri]|nr:hypothetical protein DMUE_3623 [Dictyocoela muelleri]
MFLENLWKICFFSNTLFSCNASSDEIINNEIINDEIINKEIINDEIINKEIINNEIINDEAKIIIKCTSDDKIISLQKNFYQKFTYFANLIENSKSDDLEINLELESCELELLKKIDIMIKDDTTDLNAENLFEILWILAKYELKDDYKYMIYDKISKCILEPENIKNNAVKMIEKIEKIEKIENLQNIPIDIKFWYVFYNELLGLLDSALIINKDSLELAFYPRNLNVNLSDLDASEIKKMVFETRILSRRNFKENKKTFINLLKCSFWGIFNKNNQNNIFSLKISGIITYSKLLLIQEIFESANHSIKEIFLNQLFPDFNLGPSKNKGVTIEFVKTFPSLINLYIDLSGMNKHQDIEYILKHDTIRYKLKGLRLFDNMKISHPIAVSISNFPVLEVLGLFFCNIEESSLLKILGSPILQEKIRILYFGGLTITTKYISSLKKFKSLRNIFFWNCNIKDDAIIELNNSTEFENVQKNFYNEGCGYYESHECFFEF